MGTNVGYPYRFFGRVVNVSTFGPDLANCRNAKDKETYHHESKVEGNAEVGAAGDVISAITAAHLEHLTGVQAAETIASVKSPTGK